MGRRAPTRIAAIEAQAHALDAFLIDGIRHNIPFLSALMSHGRWRKGALSTGFIAEEFPQGFSPLVADGETAKIMAAVAACADHAANLRKRRISGQLQTQRPVTFERERVVALGDQRFELAVAESAGAVEVTIGGAVMRLASAWAPGEKLWSGTVDGNETAVQIRPVLNGYQLAHRGIVVEAHVYTRREAELAELMPARKIAAAGKALLCPMPGLVKAVYVRDGVEVKAGEPLCMVEAMKMENVLRAERDVTVKSIKVKEGDSLAVDALIMEFA